MKVYNVKRLIKLSPLLLFFVTMTILIRRRRYSNQEKFAAEEENQEELTAILAPPFRNVLNDQMEFEKIDWHDEEFIRVESRRKGNGEQGEPATFPPSYNRNDCDEASVFKEYGFNGCLSDYISVNRSLPDTRPPGCRNLKYRRSLPKSSIIVPVHNERWSVLIRALYSIVNRTPAELVQEIILVDDGSTAEDMKKPLDDFVASSLPSKARVLHVPQNGLMTARSIGARNATGEILVFLDSNLEVNVNWLPPLLDLIVENEKTCVCPIIDVVVAETFMVGRVVEGFRGAFDWELNYRYFPVLPEDRKYPTKPFKSPVMTGCAFAITSRFYWELGGYDTGLQTYGGEQYELSFKIWQCGGLQVDVPCSRVAHLFRKNKLLPKGDFLDRNYKRVAEVWMDEYAEYVYQRKPHIRTMDPGVLDEQRKLREKLKCKPFKWFMEEVAFDVVRRFPLKDLPDFGSGKIIPLTDKESCLTVVNNEHVQLRDCLPTNDGQYQKDFLLSYHKDIEIKGTKCCLTVSEYDPQKLVFGQACNRETKSQLWRYDLETLQFVFGRDGLQCLTHDATKSRLTLKICDENDQNQKWLVERINDDALAKWKEVEPFIE